MAVDWGFMKDAIKSWFPTYSDSCMKRIEGEWVSIFGASVADEAAIEAEEAAIDIEQFQRDLETVGTV